MAKSWPERTDRFQTKARAILTQEAGIEIDWQTDGFATTFTGQLETPMQKRRNRNTEAEIQNRKHGTDEFEITT